MTLFCLPFAGGGATFYRPWIAELAPSIDVIPVQLPGREERFRDRAFERHEPLVEALVGEFGALLERQPFALFGHSMGALAAYEFARALQRRKLPLPAHLFVSGRRAPQLPARVPPMHDLPQAEFIERLRRLNGTPQAVLASAELMELFMPLLRADFAVSDTYVPQMPDELLACPVTALGGNADPGASLDELRAWQAVTVSPVRLYEFPGDHFFIDSQRPAVLQILRTTLLASPPPAPASRDGTV